MHRLSGAGDGRSAVGLTALAMHRMADFDDMVVLVAGLVTGVQERVVSTRR